MWMIPILLRVMVAMTPVIVALTGLFIAWGKWDERRSNGRHKTLQEIIVAMQATQQTVASFEETMVDLHTRLADAQAHVNRVLETNERVVHWLTKSATSKNLHKARFERDRARIAHLESTIATLQEELQSAQGDMAGWLAATSFQPIAVIEATYTPTQIRSMCEFDLIEPITSDGDLIGYRYCGDDPGLSPRGERPTLELPAINMKNGRKVLQ